ncbi:hypothetical protein G8770_17485 [Aestuariicella hydrocarbonica]|uniref:Uncharacterized protein n=1 Tax=Pseudomaricurvus hydrocarbonicus TaxID=1470433 RepID=A0A9E5MN94_9GAMM|nr:hypothetical protein [Aestuariicella hydrocarbonica]NHO67342.1 hypothetical protein [Aestuariicella hydrocarbonica]
MNVSISGYLTYVCNRCRKSGTVEGKSLTFGEDTSPEAQDDEYVRYVAQYDTSCASCGNTVHIELDVWEYPVAAVNYCYYSEQGVGNIECEFTIDHYFDDENSSNGDVHSEPDEARNDEEYDDEEKLFNESPIEPGYTDEYEDDDY